MACFSCGETFKSDVKVRLNKYKELYKVGYIYYKLSTDGDILITKSKSFFEIIKPKLFTKKAIKNGADFALIQEFGQTSDSNILGNNKE